jgi:hypothetical protein
MPPPPLLYSRSLRKAIRESEAVAHSEVAKRYITSWAVDKRVISSSSVDQPVRGLPEPPKTKRRRKWFVFINLGCVSACALSFWGIAYGRTRLLPKYAFDVISCGSCLTSLNRTEHIYIYIYIYGHTSHWDSWNQLSVNFGFAVVHLGAIYHQHHFWFVCFPTKGNLCKTSTHTTKLKKG